MSVEPVPIIMTDDRFTRQKRRRTQQGAQASRRVVRGFFLLAKCLADRAGVQTSVSQLDSDPARSDVELKSDAVPIDPPYRDACGAGSDPIAGGFPFARRQKIPRHYMLRGSCPPFQITVGAFPRVSQESSLFRKSCLHRKKTRHKATADSMRSVTISSCSHTVAVLLAPDQIELLPRRAALVMVPSPETKKRESG